MAILLNNAGYDNAPWREVLTRELPGLEIFEPHQITDPALIEYAVIWEHPHNDLHRYTNLKAILNLGAGTDHLDQDPSLEKLDGVPIVRLIDPDVGIEMAHYTLYWVLHFHREFELYRKQQLSREWQRTMRPRVQDWRVTVLGLGRIGTFVSHKLVEMQFNTQAWNRSEKHIDGVRVFVGPEQFHEVLENSDVVVNCLPLTPETEGLLDAACFGVMHQGSYFINISRGAIVDEESLIEALTTGQIAGAALDCFSAEPLAAASPFWDLPNVHITPHMSGATYARSAGLAVVENIKRMENGESPTPIVRTT